MTGRPPVSLGDGVRALGKLRPSEEATAEQIMSLIGLPARQPPPPTPVVRRRAAQAVEEPEPAASRHTEEPEPLQEEAEDSSPLGEAVPSSLEMHESAPTKGIENVDPLAKEEISSLPPIDPLLLPRWVRGILSAALAVPLPDGPPDVERVVEAVARGEAITELPRRPRPTLRLGVQLLVDRSARMAPFAKDQAWLEWALHRVVGEDRVELRRFIGTPLHAAASPAGGYAAAYRPPVPGTPVLALTDLGIGRPMFDPDWREPDDWLAFAELLRRAGCPLLAFVPYPQSRWPRSLAQELTVIQWDRVTSAATVRGLLGPVPAS